MPEQTAAPAAAIELAPLPSLTELTREFWRELIGGRIRVPGPGQDPPVPDGGGAGEAWGD